MERLHWAFRRNTQLQWSRRIFYITFTSIKYNSAVVCLFLFRLVTIVQPFLAALAALYLLTYGTEWVSWCCHWHCAHIWSDSLQLPHTSKLEIIWNQTAFDRAGRTTFCAAGAVQPPQLKLMQEKWSRRRGSRCLSTFDIWLLLFGKLCNDVLLHFDLLAIYARHKMLWLRVGSDKCCLVGVVGVQAW